MGRPGIFLNTTGDIDLLPHVLDAACRFQEAPSDKVMRATADKLGLEPLFTVERTGP